MYKINLKDSLGTSKAKMEGQVITKTLDTLNSGQFLSGSGKSKKISSMTESMKESTDFQKSILNSVYSDKGSIFDSKD